MKVLSITILAAASALAVSAAPAFADVACNDEGDCWHVKEQHNYKPEFKIQVHPEDWKWEEAEEKRHRWREHDGRGYWRNGLWIEF